MPFAYQVGGGVRWVCGGGAPRVAPFSVWFWLLAECPGGGGGALVALAAGPLRAGAPRDRARRLSGGGAPAPRGDDAVSVRAIPS